MLNATGPSLNLPSHPILMLIRYRGYMSFKKLSLHSYAGPLLCTLISVGLFGQVAKAGVVEANAGNSFLGWEFIARPETTVEGEAPVTGIADHNGGTVSLNFTTSGVMGNHRGVRLKQRDFDAAGISGVTKLKHLSSISWRIHHSDPLTYPRFIVTLKALPQGPPDDEFYYKKYENLNFVPGNQRLNPNQWDTVTVDFTDMGSKFQHSGPLEESDTIAINAGTNQKYTMNQ